MALLWGPEPRHSDSRSQELLFYETSQRKGGNRMVGGRVQRALCKHLKEESGGCSLTCGRRLRSLFVSLSSPPLSGRRQRDSEEGFWAHSSRSPEHFAGWGERGRRMGIHCRLLSKPQRPVPWPIFLTVSSQDTLSPGGRETGWVGWRGRGDMPGSIFGNT